MGAISSKDYKSDYVDMDIVLTSFAPDDDYVKLTVAEPRRVDKQFGHIMELTLQQVKVLFLCL